MGGERGNNPEKKLQRTEVVNRESTRRRRYGSARSSKVESA